MLPPARLSRKNERQRAENPFGALGTFPECCPPQDCREKTRDKGRKILLALWVLSRNAAPRKIVEKKRETKGGKSFWRFGYFPETVPPARLSRKNERQRAENPFGALGTFPKRCPP